MLQDCDVRTFPKKHWAYPLIALLASLVMVVRVVLVTNVYNNTIDEPYHIGSAMVLWESKQLVVGAASAAGALGHRASAGPSRRAISGSSR